MANAETLFKNANFEKKNKRFPQAEALFRKALEKDPTFWHAWNSLGCLYLDDIHDYVKAEEIFKKCITLNPDHEWGYSNLACVYCETKQWELAKKYSETALNIRVSGDALVSLGRALLGLGHPQDAIQVLVRATNVPNYHYPYYYLAQVYEQLNDRGQVIMYVRQTLSIKPDYEEAEQMLNKYLSQSQ